jgi:transposase
MRALEPEVMAKLWAAVEPLIPDVVDRHPLGTHRRRISDRVCFEAIVTRLILGCSWIDVETLFDKVVSDTTLRGRRTEWVTAGVFTRLADVALHAYDRIIGLDLSDCAIDGSCQKAPCGGDGTGPSPVDRAKLGWKWSILTDRFGIPFGWTTAGANRNDIVVAGATLDNAATRGLLQEIETLHLDKGYDSSTMRTVTAEAGLADVVCAKRRKPGEPKVAKPVVKTGSHTMGMRWPVERTNSWMSNYGQLRRNTDRCPAHREAALALGIAAILTVKLVKWHERWEQ